MALFYNVGAVEHLKKDTLKREHHDTKHSPGMGQLHKESNQLR